MAITLLPLAAQMSNRGNRLRELGFAARRDRLNLINLTVMTKLAEDRQKKDQKTAERKQRQKGTLAAGLAIGGAVAGGAFLGPLLGTVAGSAIAGVSLPLAASTAGTLAGVGIGAGIGGAIGQGFGAPNAGGAIGTTIQNFQNVAERRTLNRLRQESRDARFPNSLRALPAYEDEDEHH